jgi:hypothetical protein
MLLLPAKKEEYYAESVREMLDRIRALPGVVAVGSIGILPMEGTNSGTWYYRVDRPEPAPNARPEEMFLLSLQAILRRCAFR